MPVSVCRCVGLLFHSFFSFFFFLYHFYFPAFITRVGGFTLNELLDKPWSQVSPLLPPGTVRALMFRGA